MENKKELKNLGRAVFCMLGIVILFLLIHTTRNYLIIRDLQKKILPYVSSTNYHIKSVATEGDDIVVNMDYYRKGDRQVVFMVRNKNGEINKMTIYDNGKRTDTFVETAYEKIANLDSGNLMLVNIYNMLETENNWQTFLYSIGAKIRSKKVNDKNCYTVDSFFTTSYMYAEGENIVCIDKETGLMVYNQSGDIISEREYEFDNVDDSIFVEPDISQYTLGER